ncbi:hypothetical protein R3X28_18150 [Maribacter sp. TH_r10]|uniref:hypothetical protein n=1 Tax=Maribacter sp. TH_r10 TaxID=3082086 RepID=UPI002955BE38|nr:hypothetical protein [Maribacter sp. TH_r10]MDV7140821.1 hypothetical protein [Maribacter sp. TH_r10]
MIIIYKYQMRILALSALLLTLASCNEKKKPKQEKDLIKKEVKAPKDIISLNEASSIYNNYTKHRISVIENYELEQRAPEKEFIPARFVDFDYQTIKNYIAYVDQEASKAGVKEVTKLRLYFANYPNKGKFADGKKVVHPRQNSIFMVPTLDKNGENHGFYIGEDGKAKLISDWKHNNKMEMGANSLNPNIKSHASMIPSFTLNSSLLAGTSLVLNRGNGGPPPKSEF